MQVPSTMYWDIKVIEIHTLQILENYFSSSSTSNNAHFGTDMLTAKVESVITCTVFQCNQNYATVEGWWSIIIKIRVTGIIIILEKLIINPCYWNVCYLLLLEEWYSMKQKWLLYDVLVSQVDL